MGLSKGTPFLAKLKRAILTRKFIVVLILLWVYTIAFYYLQLVEILTFTGVLVIVLLGVPMFIAIMFTMELAFNRLTKI
jgi:hypothetical protein